MADRSNLVQAARLTAEEGLEAEAKDAGKRQDLAPCFLLAAIGAPRADYMSARTTQSPLTMPDRRLHAFPYRHKHRSASWHLGGVHIRRVSRPFS
jgi:hypothetical protein